MQEFFSDPGFLMSVLRTMTNGIMVVDKDGTILFFNKAAEEITGYRMDEVIGKPCTILDTDTCVFHGESGKDKKCRLFELGSVSKKKCHIRSKEGRVVHLLKNAIVLKDSSGEVIGAVEAMTDVTSLYMKELEIEELRHELKHEQGFMGLDGKSPVMMSLYEQIQNAARSEAPVIISGESGTGKELVALAIHKLSRRNKGPYIKVNCAALNEFLLESELFGHVRGAFTGAVKDREGRFEAANNGSIFLDEIGDMSQSMQVKLLRVIQEREIERVGDHRPIHVNIRLITATNKDLHELVEKGQFRDDLYYRINVIPIRTPALRERKDDLPLIISHILRRINLVNSRTIQRVTPEAIEAIEAYHWPGNVRQLINALEFAAISCREEVIGLADLPDYIVEARNRKGFPGADADRRECLLAALRKHNWNRTLTANYLGISRVTLWKMIKELNISSEPTASVSQE